VKKRRKIFGSLCCVDKQTNLPSISRSNEVEDLSNERQGNAVKKDPDKVNNLRKIESFTFQTVTKFAQRRK